MKSIRYMKSSAVAFLSTLVIVSHASAQNVNEAVGNLQKIVQAKLQIREVQKRLTGYKRRKTAGAVLGTDAYNKLQDERLLVKLQTQLQNDTTSLNQEADSSLATFSPILENAFPSTSLTKLSNYTGITNAESFPYEVSFYSPARNHKSARDLFFNIKEEFVSPYSRADEVNFLVDSIGALQRKLEILTGSSIPRSVIENSDFNYELDFSHAPHFDEILVSTLFIRKDFTGTMIARALKWHATHGTKVKLMVSQTALWGMQLTDGDNGDKDAMLIADLMTDESHNIEVQKVLFEPPQIKGATYEFDQLHRAHHAKFIVTYSASQPELNRVIVGGRNLSDAYVFKKAPNYVGFPKIIQYSPASYLPTEDIELELKDASLAKRVKAQFDAFWNRSTEDMSFVTPTMTLPVATLAATKEDFYSTTTQNKVYVRYFFSVPFLQDKDNNIEGLFAQMLDSAQKRILITTPYFHLTEKLEQAMRDAHDRGVQITVLTNTDMSGDDFAPSAVTNANRSGIRVLAKYITIRSWNKPEIMLHAKMMLVDDDLLYVGSINMNMRSFVHDNENGVLMTGKPIIDRYKDLFQNYYFPQTHLIDRKELKPGFKATPINMLLYLAGDLF